MPGPTPKPPEIRRRKNKKAEAAELEAPAKIRIPALPNPDKRTFHRLTRIWWKHVWASPMASRYLQTDADALGMIAILIDDFYKKPTQALAGEIRLQTARFGLSNIDRNRMDWSIKPSDAPKQSGSSSTSDDPRKVLKFER